MKKKFFGTDGIRGAFNEFPITRTFFFSLTKAIKLTVNYLPFYNEYYRLALPINLTKK